MPSSAAPTRLVVLLFSDIVGSVQLKSRLGDAQAAAIISRYDRLFRDVFEQVDDGEILKDTGDGFLAQFNTVSSAVNFALLFQDAMRRFDWHGSPLHVRVGLHLGEVSELDPDPEGGAKLSGLAIDLTARVMGLAEGGQILLTRAMFDSARQYVRQHPVAADGHVLTIRWMAHGPYLFKGTDEPLEVFEVGAEGEVPLRAPQDSEKARRAIAPGQDETLGWRPAIALDVPTRGGWKLERRIGEGGFGEVWLGVHEKTHVYRAFKFCFDQDRLRSLKRELTLFRVLREVLGDRDDIARLYEVQLDEAPYFLEVEFTEARDLNNWARMQGGIDKVPLATRLDLVARMARAVAAAHSVGVLHKDIKPANILIHQIKGGEPRPRLADFWHRHSRRPHRSRGAADHHLRLQRPAHRRRIEPHRQIEKGFGTETVIVTNNYAAALTASGAIDQAEQQLREAFQHAQTQWGNDSLITLAAANNLGAWLITQEKYQDTVDLLNPLLGTARDLLGPYQPDCIIFTSNLARALLELRNLDCEPLLKNILDEAGDHLGSDYPAIQTARFTYADLLNLTGRAAEAEKQFKALLTDRITVYGEDDAKTFRVRGELVFILDDAGKYDEAEPMYRQLAAATQATLGDDDRETISWKNNLPAFLRNRQRYAEAEPIYKEVIAAADRVFGDDEWQRWFMHGRYGMCLLSMGRAADAVTELEHACNGMETHLGLDNARTKEAIGKLIECYEALNRSDDAQRLREKHEPGV